MDGGTTGVDGVAESVQVSGRRDSASRDEKAGRGILGVGKRRRGAEESKRFQEGYFEKEIQRSVHLGVEFEGKRFSVSLLVLARGLEQAEVMGTTLGSI